MENTLDSSSLTSPLLGDSESFEDDNKIHNDPVKKSSLDLPQNSYALTTFLLLNTMIGSGILNQPFVFENSGMIGGSFGFFLTCILTWLGLVLLTDAGIFENVYEYSSLAERAFGKIGEIVIDWSIIISSFGSQLGYILVIGDTLTGVLQSWGCNRHICEKNLVTVFAVTIFVSPFCLFRHFGHFAILSVFSISTITMVLLLVVIGGPERENKGTIELFNLVGSIRSVGSIVFALNCASANFQAFISTEKSCQNRKSWRSITFIAVLVGTIMCVVMGIVGYISFKNQTDGEILDNFSGHGFDFFKLMVVAHLILYIPVNFVIMRYSLLSALAGLKAEQLSWPSHVVFSLGLLALTTVTVLAFLNSGLTSGAAFGLILNLTGGIGGSLSAFILPAAIYLKLMPKTDSLYFFAKLELIAGIVIMLAVVCVTIWSLVE